MIVKKYGKARKLIFFELDVFCSYYARIGKNPVDSSVFME